MPLSPSENIDTNLTTSHSSSVEQANKLKPTILWGQDKAQIFITVTCRGSKIPVCEIRQTGQRLLNDNEKSRNVDDQKSASSVKRVDKSFLSESPVEQELYVEGPNHFLSLPLFGTIDVESFTWKSIGDEVVSISMQKRTPRVWPRLAWSSKKLHFIRIDWSKWVEEPEASDQETDSNDLSPKPSITNCNELPGSSLTRNDTELHSSNDSGRTSSSTRVVIGDGTIRWIAPLIPFGEGSPIAIAIESSDCRDLSNDTVPLLVETTKIEDYWSNQLTTAQRLHTLTHMWNASPLEQRSNVLKTLVELMEQIDSRFAAHVKGGQDVLKDLLTDEYSNRYITFSQSMIDQLREIKSEKKRLEILVTLFSLASEFEKKIICSTFL